MAAVLWAFGAGASAAETRSAIVIGNSDYAGAVLANPRNDATLMAQTLQELGFDVSLYLNVTRQQTPLMAEQIRQKLAGADVAVLYFAGHGLQYRGENLLLPVDTDLTSVAGIAQGGTPLSAMLQSVTEGAKGIKIVILDACRTNLAQGDGDELKAGFNFVEAPAGEVLIAFATGAGELAFDSAGGSNSPYTTALANALQERGADIYDVFRSVRRAVRSGTGGQQIPWITGSIETDYVFRPGVKPAAAPETASGQLAAGQVVTAYGEVLSIDKVLWEYLQSSANPRDFARFSEVFPASPFVRDAREREQFQLASIGGETLTRDGIDLSTQSIAEEVDSSLPETPEKAARSSLLLDQSGSYVMRNSFRTWPLDLPATETGLRSMATECDEEAADPVDPDKLSPGISDASINIRR
ncbi:MAG TPA: caspase domain-containing protein, partial [Paracoccaceae bacterium]